MQGYFRAYSETVRQASHDLALNELRVYMALLSYANCEGMCWPGIARLVADTGINTTGIYATLDALVALKYISIVRTGTRDALTHQQLPNVYRVVGAVIDDDCDGDEFRPDDPIPFSSSKQESKHHQRTQPKNTTKETQPETPPPTQPISSKVEVQKPKPNAKTGKEKTPERSSIPKPPNPVPQPPSPRVYTGPLDEYAEALPAEQEQAAVNLTNHVERKLPLRLARRLIAKYGQAQVDIALAHMAKMTDIYNPPGYLLTLLARQAVEAADAAPVDPGLKYITGKYAHLIEH